MIKRGEGWTLAGINSSIVFVGALLGTIKRDGYLRCFLAAVAVVALPIFTVSFLRLRNRMREELVSPLHYYWFALVAGLVFGTADAITLHISLGALMVIGGVVGLIVEYQIRQLTVQGRGLRNLGLWQIVLFAAVLMTIVNASMAHNVLSGLVWGMAWGGGVLGFAWIRPQGFLSE